MRWRKPGDAEGAEGVLMADVDVNLRSKGRAMIIHGFIKTDAALPYNKSVEVVEAVRK